MYFVSVDLHIFSSQINLILQDVVLIGLASTDQLYFASGHLGVAGAMFTASHNPAQYNGIKLCREHAQPVGRETGLEEIRARVEAGEEPSSWAVRESLEAAGAHGLIDPSRTAPGLWHLTLFRWNDDGGPRVRLVEAGT